MGGLQQSAAGDNNNLTRPPVLGLGPSTFASVILPAAASPFCVSVGTDIAAGMYQRVGQCARLFGWTGARPSCFCSVAAHLIVHMKTLLFSRIRCHN
jgi:hypothetical protein